MTKPTDIVAIVHLPGRPFGRSARVTRAGKWTATDRIAMNAVEGVVLLKPGVFMPGIASQIVAARHVADTLGGWAEIPDGLESEFLPEGATP